MSKILRIRFWTGVAVLSVAFVLLVASLLANQSHPDTESTARDLGRRVEKRLALLDSYATQALESDPSTPHLPYTYLEAFCIRRELLITLVDETVSQGYHHLTRDVLMEAISKRTLKVNGFENPGRVWYLDSVQSYFKASMELLNRDTRADLFPADRPILTKLRDEMPTHHCDGAKVKNSLIADGCVIEGTVENCILFRGVHIAKGAVVRNCIIMQDSKVLEDAELQYCIMDKQATVQPKGRLLATESYPIVVAKNYTV